MSYNEPQLPSLETIASLAPLAEPYNRPISDVLHELNHAIEAAGIPFGEYGYTSLLRERNAVFEECRWIDCAAVIGSNEGYYIHITLVPSDHDTKPARLIATAKTWSRASALAIAAASSRLLGAV